MTDNPWGLRAEAQKRLEASRKRGGPGKFHRPYSETVRRYDAQIAGMERLARLSAQVIVDDSERVRRLEEEVARLCKVLEGGA